MFAILGATGHVGGSTCRALRDAGRRVRAIVRDAGTADGLREIGCEVVAADLRNSAALALALADADAVQIIVPLSPQAQDPVEHMVSAWTSIMSALQKARPSRVLVISDYGAHVGENIGMPSVFHQVEAQVRQFGEQTLILRSAEHMHNWARSFPTALETGMLPSFQHPVDRSQPTISAPDLGRIAADLLCRPASAGAVEVIHAEGPRRYSAADVAGVLSALSGRPIRAQSAPRDQWAPLLGTAMPRKLADLLIQTNDAKNIGGLVDVEPGSNAVLYGVTSLIDALRPLLLPSLGS